MERFVEIGGADSMKDDGAMVVQICILMFNVFSQNICALF